MIDSSCTVGGFWKQPKGLYPPDFLNSIKNKDLCDQVQNLAEPLWGLLWVLIVVLAAFLAC